MKRNYLEPSHISLTLVFISSIWPCLPQTVAGYVRAQGKSAQADGKSASYRIGTQAPAKRSNSSFLWANWNSPHRLSILSMTSRVRTTLQSPPITNIAVMVRDRSRPTLVVRAGLQPPISVYCTQFFFCLHLFWADACLATPAVDGNSFHSGGRLTNDLQFSLLVQRASVGRYCSCLCIPTVQI